MFIDVPENGLSFTGSGTTLSSFTFGCYYFMSTDGSLTWFVLTQHSLATGAFWPTYTRMSFHAFTNYVALYQVNSAGSTFTSPIVYASKTGWVHWTLAYEASTGILPFYQDGLLSFNGTIPTASDQGTSGGSPLFFSFHFHFPFNCFLFSSYLFFIN